MSDNLKKYLLYESLMSLCQSFDEFDIGDVFVFTSLSFWDNLTEEEMDLLQDRPNIKDAIDNVIMNYNLYKTGECKI